MSLRTIRLPSFCQLLLNQLVVISMFLQQLIVVSCLLDLSILHHKNSICVYDRGQPVSNYYDGRPILAVILR